MKPLALLTNDDGYASPGLRALWRALDADFETMVVAPARGKSWIGKALSNPGALTLETKHIDEQEIWLVHDGTPADCVNLGMYHICARKPDVVVSGINIGANFTASLALASGTVGAALEAAVNDVLGIAVSLDLDDATHHALQGEWNESHVEIFMPAARAAKLFLREWFARPPQPRIKLINLIMPQPRNFIEPPRFVECAPLPYAYGSVFEKRDNVFYNRTVGFIAAQADVRAGSDVWNVRQGSIAFTCYSGKLEQIASAPQEK